MEAVIILIAIVIIGARLYYVMHSYDETCVQVKLCGEGKMICNRKPKCKAYKRSLKTL